jgi:exodeoxyribonuclease-3
MLLRIATYNVNSIRIRLHALEKLVHMEKPDILCLQETKVEDKDFPAEEIRRLGFQHIHISGQKSYNGVAILSRVPLYNIHSMDVEHCGHKRHIGASLQDGTEIHNFYVPAGGDIPDPTLNDKFDLKLRFMEALSKWALEPANKNKAMILMGDLNIAPLENDVWSHKQLLKIVSHTPVETDAMKKLQKTLGWIDTARQFVPEHEKLYSWWSYRNQDWQKSDRGRRLDHIWITPPLASGMKATRILREARGWESPSDHVPVVMEIKI